jgi:exodeoxyribonuclease VII small subunit
MDQTPIADMKFETAVAELEDIVSSMEGGKLELEASIAAYKRGMELMKHCQAQLANAEEEIRISRTAKPGSSTARPWRPERPALCRMDGGHPGPCRIRARRFLPGADSIPARLHEAMRYATSAAASACARCSPTPPAS